MIGDSCWGPPYSDSAARAGRQARMARERRARSHPLDSSGARSLLRRHLDHLDASGRSSKARLQTTSMDS